MTHMTTYFVSIRQRLDGSLFNPTIYGDRFVARTASEARMLASRAYDRVRLTRFGDALLDALAAKMPPLNQCEVIVRKVRA